MFLDFVNNGQIEGQLAEQLGHPTGMVFDPGIHRPFINSQGIKCVTLKTNKVKMNAKGNPEPIYQTYSVRDLQRKGLDFPVWNATTTLRKDQWIAMDRRVVMATRQRLQLWSYLSSRVSFGGFDAFGHMTLEYEAMSDPGEALVSMDGLQEGRDDTPRFALRSMPLPIVHSDFRMSSRLLANSRNNGRPLDTTKGEAHGRRVGEMVEKLAIGRETGPEWGTVTTGPNAHDGLSKLYGLINYPDRLTKTDLTTPTGSNPDATIADVLEMREQVYSAGFFGPFVIFHSTDWDQYLDRDYYTGTYAQGLTSPGTTLRERLRRIQGISDVIRLDFLPSSSYPFRMNMVQVTSDVVEAINGMAPTLIQWTDKGGMELRFKIMAIQCLRLKHDYNNNCGVLDATTS